MSLIRQQNAIFKNFLQGALMPLVTLLGLVGNSLSILVLHTPGVDMKVSATELFLEKFGIELSHAISLRLQTNIIFLVVDVLVQCTIQRDDLYSHVTWSIFQDAKASSPASRAR